jgi:hypothetical protein
MLWSVSSGDGQWITVDAIYCVGLLILGYGLWVNRTSRETGWIMPIVGWLLVMSSFLGRFAMLLSGDWRGHENYKIIALTRCVLHTLVLPLTLVFVWCIARLIYEQVRGRRKWWLTGLCLALIIACAWMCGCCIWSFYMHYSTYPDKSLFP